MRGLVVLFLLLLWPLPALPGGSGAEPVRLAQHAPAEDSGAAGHALDSGPIDEGDQSSETADGTGRCDRAEGLVAYYSCRAQALVSGSLQAVILPLLAMLALLMLSMVLLWVYTRRAANAARLAAEYVPAVERAYVFGGPTDLFLLHDQASVRLAMQNYGKTPAVIREWSVEFVAQEPRGSKPAYDKSKRTPTNEILEPFKLFSPPTVFRSEIPAPFFIVGYIGYDDVFRQSHTTRFCVGVARDGKAAYAGHAQWNVFD
jgi:hypothetical protein